jgi:hypothetical protein
MQRLREELVELAWLGAAVSGLCILGTVAGAAFALVLYPM